jgi:hypothetical protein
MRPELEEHGVETSMKALLIYNDFKQAVEVRRLMEQAASRADVTARWRVKPWLVDLMLLPPAAELALEEGADAELLVVAVGRQKKLTPGLWEWLEKWAGGRQVQEAALTVFEEGGRPGP